MAKQQQYERKHLTLFACRPSYSYLCFCLGFSSVLLYFIPLIYISLFVPVSYCVDDYSFVVEPEVRQVDSSSSILLSQDCFGYLSFFLFPYKLLNNCSSSVKNTIGSLIGIALNIQITLGSILIFTILILPIHEHGIFLHLLVSSLISFISVLQFSIYRSLVSLGRYIPKYVIIFVAMVNGIVSLIYFSTLSLLVYRNASDFCLLIYILKLYYIL